jgi:hypothetical protein
MNFCSIDLDFFRDPENCRKYAEAIQEAGKDYVNLMKKRKREIVLKTVKECHYFNNLVDMENKIRQAERNFNEDQKFINELKEYRDDLKIKNFYNSLGDNADGFQLFMLKFREKLIEDIKAEIEIKKDV